MRYVTLVLVGALGALPMLGETASKTALEAAVRFVPAVLNGTMAPETHGLDVHDFVIAEEPVACDQEFLAEWLQTWHGDAIADELVSSYRLQGAQPSAVPSHLGNVPVLALRRFEIGDDGYDWPALRAAFPTVRGVVRISLPAEDSLGVYAVAHYEVITAKGAAFANFQRFEKQSNGMWRPTSGVTGSLGKTAANRGVREARAPR
jgi:hypothetical protein